MVSNFVVSANSPPASPKSRCSAPSTTSTTEDTNDDSSVHSTASSTPFPDADFSMLSKVPKELLSANTPQSQDLRLRLLRGSTIVFFGTGYPAKRFIYERAHDLGVNVVLVDEPDAWCKSLVEEGKVYKFIPMNIMSPDQDRVVADTVAALSELDHVDGICTFYELALQTMARIGEELGGVHSPSEHSIMTARDKYASRRALKVAGLPSVENYLIKSEDDLLAAANVVGFPAVLKPLSGSASQGVKKVTDLEDLRMTYRDTRDLISGMVVVDGEFSGNCASDGPRVHFGDFMLEEYLDGAEVDVDMIMCGDKCVYAAVHDNGPTVEPYFMETWDVMPSMLPKDQVESLEKMAVDSVRAMGFTDGVFHVEGKYTGRRGARLIEVNARLGGGPIYIMNKIANGVDLVDEALLLSVGIPSAPVELPWEKRYAIACSTINAVKSGVVSDLSFIEQWNCMEGVEVVSNTPLVKKGEHIVGPEEGQPTWLEDIIFKAPVEDLMLVGDLAIKLDKEAAEEFERHYV